MPRRTLVLPLGGRYSGRAGRGGIRQSVPRNEKCVTIGKSRWLHRETSGTHDQQRRGYRRICRAIRVCCDPTGFGRCICERFRRISGRAGPSGDLADGSGLYRRSGLPPPVAVRTAILSPLPKGGDRCWPPVFYGALGIWFLIFGASRGAAMMFIAIVAATTASVIYFTGKRLIGRWAGVLAAVLFVASPLVQEFERTSDDRASFNSWRCW